MEMKFMNIENSETNGPQKFIFNLSQRLDLKSSNKTCIFNFKTCIFITPGKI